MDCIDIRERFGLEYKVTTDPAVRSTTSDPWYLLIPCERGMIYPFGGDKLAVEVHPRTGRLLLDIPGIRLHQDGDLEMSLVFPVDLFPAVAAIVLPRRRRRLSPERRAKLVEASLPFRFKPGVQGGSEKQGRVPDTRDGPAIDPNEIGPSKAAGHRLDR
ncbi:hypothetical protein AYO40_03085 [Planctomycetaceae bacterium SCGC AG-212-D15]|nr:hypothetical protein AYO40_03085 [Planctomycetaceae bacterium SCGC AG-212-D15]